MLARQVARLVMPAGNSTGNAFYIVIYKVLPVEHTSMEAFEPIPPNDQNSCNFHKVEALRLN